jgi:hypothetical protein
MLVVAVASGTVFSVLGPSALGKKVTMDNLDQANTLTYKFQWSDDGTTWTDVAANAALAPLASVHVDLTGHIYHQMVGSGNLNIAVEISVRVANVTTFSFSTI